MTGIAGSPTRAQLAAVFDDPRTLLAVEQLFQNANANFPDDIAALTAEVNALSTSVTSLGASVSVLKALTYIVQTLNGAIPNARTLAGSTGVTFDYSTAGVAEIIVNVATALGYTPVNPGNAVHLLSTLLVDGLATFSSGIETTSIKIDQTATASVTASDHSIPINCNGTVYYMRLSATP